MDKFSVLQQYFGHSSFRPGQEQVVDAIISGRDRKIAILNYDPSFI